MNCISCFGSISGTRTPVVSTTRWQTGSSSSSSTGWTGRGRGEGCHLTSLSIATVGIPGGRSIIPFIRLLHHRRRRRRRQMILYAAGSVFESNGKARQRTAGHRILESIKGEIKAPFRSGLTKKLLHNAVDNDKSLLGGCTPDFEAPSEKQRAGSDFLILTRRFWKVAAPYWSSEDRVQARWRLAAVLALTLATTGISVAFNFLGRDFYNALANKDQEQFVKQLFYYLGAFVGGIPVFVIRDYTRDKLALRWRAWMTKYYMDNYFENQTFYKIQSQSLIDNPDQRIVDDLNSFTSTSLAFALALFNSTIDLISFSGILYGIYPPLFAVLIVYSIGGTALSVALGKGLVGLNFMQEKREADFRYGLVRVRENAESIAFYGGEDSEIQLLLERFKQSFSNYSQLLIASRNLDFFTSAYRYLIQLLPAAVVAPLYFAGKIEFGVINQSFSAFNHILSDFSIIVYQFQSISAFSAVIDRLGEFNELLQQQNASSRPTTFLSASSDTTQRNLPETLTTPRPIISIVNIIDSVMSTSVRSAENKLHFPLLEIEHLTLQTPQYTSTLVEDLSFTLNEGEHLLIMGASGSGKTSLLRAIGGLWTAGKGTIKRHFVYELDGEANGALKPMIDDETDNVGDLCNDLKVPVSDEVTIDGNEQQSESELGPQLKLGIEKERLPKQTIKENQNECQQIFFLPQRPYMVLGSLRQQILYPAWTEQTVSILDRSQSKISDDSAPFGFGTEEKMSPSEQTRQPSDAELIEVLELVNLGHLMDGCDGLDALMEWSSILSLGEQQRIAFARLLISKPRLALLDESTSALDEDNEIQLYQEIEKAGITYVSVGHRSTLQRYHRNILRFKNSQADGTGRNWTIGPLVPQLDQEVLGSPF